MRIDSSTTSIRSKLSKSQILRIRCYDCEHELI